MNRRDFLATSMVAAAASSVSARVLPRTITPRFTQTNAQAIPSPSLAGLVRSNTHTDRARLTPNAFHQSELGAPIYSPRLTLRPLACVADRIHTNSSISVEVYYPTSMIYAVLYAAHNTKTGAFPATNSTNAPQDSAGLTTMRITQRISERTKSKLITIDTTRQGEYILAIPTAHQSSSAHWRLSSAQLDHTGRVIKLTNPFQSSSAHCAYLNILIDE
jgi:hypothetical protein